MNNSALTNKLTSYESLLGLRNDFRALLETGQFADARVICYENAAENGGEGEGERKREEIPVHKAILASHSELFADEFSGGRDEIEIQDLSLPMVKAILSYIYCDKNPIVEMGNETLLEFYKAAKPYGLAIFKTQNAQSKFVFKNFPKKFAYMTNPPSKYRHTLSGETIKAFSMDWQNEMTMEARRGQQGGGKRIHLDFLMRPSTGTRQKQIFVVDISLSILNSVDEKLKTVKKECFTRGEINWADCFDFYQLVRDDLLQCTSRRYNRETQLVVLCEATIVTFSVWDAFGALLETGRFSDARIVCYENGNSYGKSDERKVVIPVHKCILAASSKFFTTAFSIEMREAESGEVVIPPETGFYVETIRAMLSYIYTAAIPQGLEQTSLITLFKAAHFYQFEGLMLICSDLMEITTENWCDTLLMADFYGSESLKGKALMFIRKNLNIVKKTEEWQNLMESAEEQLKMELPLTVENCFELLTLADTHNNEQLKRDVFYFLEINKEELKATEGWRQLMASDRSDLKMMLPSVIENCAELLTLADAHDNEGVKGKALRFLADNKAAVKATDGWHRLMQGESEETEKLRTLCGHWMMETPVTVENCAEVLRISYGYRDWSERAMKQKALDFYWMNLEAVEATDGWLKFMAEEGEKAMNFVLEDDEDDDDYDDIYSYIYYY